MNKSSIQTLLSMLNKLYLNMFLAVIFGVLGYLCAILLPTVVIYFLFNENVSFDNIFLILIMLGLFRGIFRYVEQYSNHYIAFKILAIFRIKIFNKLRKLPVYNKNNNGDILSSLTGDIELIEVFYAHTISPILISIVIFIIFIFVFAFISPVLAIVAGIMYIIIGVILPVINIKFKSKSGEVYREEVSNLNQYFLDKINGVFDLSQYFDRDKLDMEIDDISKQTESSLKKIKQAEIILLSVTELFLVSGYVIFIACATYLYSTGAISMLGLLFSVILFLNSFGPFLALNNLSNNLIQTIASIKRIINILSQEEIVSTNNLDIKDIQNLKLSNISFSHDGTNKLINNFSYSFEKGKVYGLYAKSGCGKTTLLKLISRDLKLNSGNITYDDIDYNEFAQEEVNDLAKYMNQDFYYFNDSIKNNVDLKNEHKSIDEYLTSVELNQCVSLLENKEDEILLKNRKVLSSGELQRLNLLRTTIYNSKILLLDEPTSNVDSLNEAIILNSIKENACDKITIIVSHKESTLRICDEIITSLN